MKNDEFQPYAVSNAQTGSDVSLNSIDQSTQGGFDIHEILFIVYNHKWKILTFGIIGLVAAACLYLLKKPLYQSQAKLLVHYVIDTHTIDQLDTRVTSERYMAAAIKDELQILTSLDLAQQVIESGLIDPQKILPNAEEPLSDIQIQQAILRGLEISIKSGSNVISVAYSHADPEVSPLVLNVLVSKYFEMHLKTHRSGIASEILERKIFQVKESLRMVDEIITGSMAEISSIDDEKLALTAQKQKIVEELVLVEAELAVQTVRVESAKALAEPQEDATLTELDSFHLAATRPDDSDLETFNQIASRLNGLIEQKDRVSLTHKPESNKIKTIQRQIDATEREKIALIEQFPSIASRARQQFNGNQYQYGANLAGLAEANLDPRTELTRLAEIEARMRRLQQDKQRVDLEMKRVAQVALSIAPHQRKKEIIETQLHSLEMAKAKADGDNFLSNEASTSGLPNISLVQKPSAALPVQPKRVKQLSMVLALGGFAFGGGLAFLIEMFFDRSIKQSQEFRSRLRLPLMLSIPYMQLLQSNTEAVSKPKQNRCQLAEKRPQFQCSLDSPIRPFADAVRDRLAYDFEVNQITHKPKVIAVTGFSDGVGTSSIACGLAASFGEVNSSNVLYVNLNANSSPSESHGLVDREDWIHELELLDDALELQMQNENILIARFGSTNSASQTRSFTAKQLIDLIVKLRSISCLDYVVFDMPPLGPTSPTSVVAGFMDKFLMVAAAGKTNRETVKHAYQELAAKKVALATILNKTRVNLPAWLQG